MKYQRQLRNASTALALLAVCAATAVAQTPPAGWPWGSGFERRHAASTVAPVEPLPQADTTATATATTGSGSSKPGQTQGSGQSNSTDGRGNGSGGSGRGR